MRCAPVTLFRQFAARADGETTLKAFIDGLSVLRVYELRRSGLNWKRVACRTKLGRTTIARRIKAWPGCTPGELERLAPDRLFAAFTAAHVGPVLPAESDVVSTLGNKYTVRTRSTHYSMPSHIRLPDGDTWVPDPSYARTLGLAGGGRGALVWQSLSPFRVWRIGEGPAWAFSEFERVSAEWFHGELAGALRASPAIWSATSVVTVGPRYVKTLANRGTDDRLLIWFDERGRFLRYVAVEAPFGFVMAATEAPVMLAMRTLNDSELVKYSWASARDSTRSKGER